MGKYIYKETRFHRADFFCAYGPRVRRAGAYRAYASCCRTSVRGRTFVRFVKKITKKFVKIHKIVKKITKNC